MATGLPFDLNASIPSDDPVEQARRTWVILQQSIPGSLCKSGWRCATDTPTRMPELINRERVVRNLGNISVRLMRVQIECQDAVKVIQRFDAPDTLFYLDPPYPHATRNATKRYRLEWTNDQHQELAEVLNQVKGW